MTPVELEAALDQVLRGDQGAAQRIIDHNKRLELINTDYELGKHADAQQVATLTAQLATAQARILELEQALRLHLAVDPNDPILIIPKEAQL